MKAGIALIGDGAGAVGVWQTVCAMHLSDLPLLAADEAALPILCRLLCRKYHVSPRRQRRMERGGAAAHWELLRLSRRMHGVSPEPLKPGALLFFFSRARLLICAPGTDVFCAEGKRLCADDRELLRCVLRASRRSKSESIAPVWPLCAAGAEKTVAFLLNVQGESSARRSFRISYEGKGASAADEVFRELWRRRAELYDALLF